MSSKSSKGRQIEPGSPLDTVQRVLGSRATQDHVKALIYFARNLEDVFPSSPVLKSRRESVKQKRRYRFQEADYPFVFNLLTLHEFLGGRPKETKDLIDAIRERQELEVRKILQKRRAQLLELQTAFSGWNKLSGVWLASLLAIDIDRAEIPLEATRDVEPDPAGPVVGPRLRNLRAAEALAEFRTGKQSDSPEELAERAFYFLELKRVDLAQELLSSVTEADASNGAVAFVQTLVLIAQAAEKCSRQFFHHEEAGGGLPPIDSEELYHEEQSQRMEREAEAASEKALALLLVAFENWPDRFRSKVTVDLFAWKRRVIEESLKLFNRGYGREPAVLARVRCLIERAWAEGDAKRVAPHALGSYIEYLAAARNCDASVFEAARENLCTAITRPYCSYGVEMIDHRATSWVTPKEDFSWSDEWPSSLAEHAKDGRLPSLLAPGEAGARFRLEAEWLARKSAVEADLLLHRHHLRLLGALRRLGIFGVQLADYPSEDAVKIASLSMDSLPWHNSELSQRLQVRWAYVLFQLQVIEAIKTSSKGDRGRAMDSYRSAGDTLCQWPEIARKRRTHFYVQNPDDTHEVIDMLGNSGHILRANDRTWPSVLFFLSAQRDGSVRQEVIHLIRSCHRVNGGCFFEQLGRFIRSRQAGEIG